MQFGDGGFEGLHLRLKLLQPVHEAENGLAPCILQLEADHGAIEARGEEARDGGRVRVRRVAGEMDPLDLGPPGKPHRDPGGVGALALHAQRKRLDAAHGEVALERAENGSAGAGERAQRLVVFRVRGDRAAEHVAVAGQKLGEAMHHQVGAQLERPHQHGRGEGVIHHEGNAGRARDCSQPVDGPDAEQRVRHGLHQQAARLARGHGPLDRGEIADIDVGHLDPQRLEYLVEQTDGGAVQGPGGEDGFRPVHQRGQ